MKKIILTTEQKNGITHFLKKRIDNIDDYRSDRKLYDFYVKPLISSKLKIEDCFDNEVVKLTKLECLIVEGCIREYAPKEIYQDEITDSEIKKIKEPFSSVLKLL